MLIKKQRKTKLFFIATLLIFISLISIVNATTYFVTADLGSDYTYQGTTVRYIKAVDVSDLSVSEMKMLSPMDGTIAKTGLKTIGSPTIGSVQRIFSSTTGTTKGVTITVNGGADTTVNYNAALNDYVYTVVTSLPRLYSKIPGENGVFLLMRYNDSAKKGDISDKNNLILLQDASYIYVSDDPNRAVLYKIVSPIATDGILKQGTTPYYNTANFGDTITHPGNNVSLDGYTSFGVNNPSGYAGKYSAVAMEYDGTRTFSIYGFVPTILMDGDRTLTWNGAVIPTSYTKNSGDVTLSLSTKTGIYNISYVLIKSDETYDAKVNVNTSALAGHITTEWDSLGSTAPVMSNILENIILNGVGTDAEDPYTYAIKRSSETTYPASATTWSTIAITSGYGISGYAKANSVVVPNADLNTLTPGTYYVYMFATDADLSPLAFDRQTITIAAAPAPTPAPTSSGGGGGGGGGGGFAGSIITGSETSEITVTTTTGILNSNEEGVVQVSAEIDAADGLAGLVILSGTTALDAAGQPLTDITIQAIAQSSAPPAPGTGMVFTFNNMYYQCEPTGAQFNPAIDIVFQLTEEEYNSLDPNQQFSIQYYDAATGNWVEITTYINPNTFQVIGEISHFSTFALMVKETGRAAPTTEIPTEVPVSSTEEAFPIWIWGIVIIAIIAVLGVTLQYYNKNIKK